MKRHAKGLITFGLILFFVSAVLCATMAAPRQSFASVTACSQTDVPMTMADCDHPTFLCDFNRSSALFSRGALSSAHVNEWVKTTFAIAVGEACFGSTAYGGAFLGQHTSAFPTGRHKVSIHLYNSVLTI